MTHARQQLRPNLAAQHDHHRERRPVRDRSRSDKRAWFVPTLLGSAAALGAAALYNAKKTRDAERKHPPSVAFSTWTACACTTSSVGQASLWCSFTAMEP